MKIRNTDQSSGRGLAAGSIFLSAGMPQGGDDVSAATDVFNIREAIIAFTRVCMEHSLPFYFGGHPAITPLVCQVAKCYGYSARAQLITVYQSAYFKTQLPADLTELPQVVMTPEVQPSQEGNENLRRRYSICRMREEMFKQEASTHTAVFIGGKDGIKDEYERLHRLNPQIRILPFKSTGGEAARLYDRLVQAGKHLDERLAGSTAYAALFEELLNHLQQEQYLSERTSPSTDKMGM